MQLSTRRLARKPCHCTAVASSRRFFEEELALVRGETLSPRTLELSRAKLAETGGKTWDFIYSPALFSQLGRADASRLVTAAFPSLEPGGRMVIANLTHDAAVEPCPRCSGPVRFGRSEYDLADLAGDLPDSDLAARAIYRDETGLNLFLEMHKRHRPSLVGVVRSAIQ